jgi:sec-independent protein translocase protein TatB
MPELILIAVVALIVLGPKRLPDLAKSMGRAVREFRKATSELKETLQVDSEFTEVKKAFQDFQSDVNRTVQSEGERKETPADPQPPAVPAGPEPEKPSSADKLDELKRAFGTWKADSPPTSPDQTAAAPTPPPDKPKSS